MKPFWQTLIGTTPDFKVENIAFNAVSLLTTAVLLVLLPFNLLIGLKEASFIIGILIGITSFLYYQARFRRKYLISLTVYAISTYVALIFFYFFNSGVDGPIIFLFFLTYALLNAFTPKTQHLLWLTLHSIVGIGLLSISYFHPDWVKYNYGSQTSRFIDIGSSYLITLAVILLITNYLRNNYLREKELAELRARKIGRQKELLENVNNQKNKLFSIIAHDLRSPLNSIQSFLELLSDEKLTAEEKALIESNLLTQTRHTSDLLMNLLSWSKTQMDGISMHLQEVHLLSALEATLEMQRMIAGKKNIQLMINIDESLRVHGDPHLLQLIVRNLVNNSIKFSPPNRAIEVAAKPDKNSCVLTVKDEGIGIPAEKQQRLFTFKGETTYGTQNEKGVGLGLMLCKEFIELHKGKLWFVSAEGNGTTFYVRLPTTANTKAMSDSPLLQQNETE